MRNVLKYIFIGFIFIGGANVFSQGVLKAYISDETGTPLTDWQISIISDSLKKKEKITGISEYSLQDFPAGIYTVRIEKKGYQVMELTQVPVKSNSITALSFKLKKRNCGDKKIIDSQEFKPRKVDPER